MSIIQLRQSHAKQLKCDCNFNTNMQLPCVHILIVFEQCEYLQEQELD